MLTLKSDFGRAKIFGAKISERSNLLLLNSAVIKTALEVGGEHTAQRHRLSNGLHQPERFAVLWWVTGQLGAGSGGKVFNILKG